MSMSTLFKTIVGIALAALLIPAALADCVSNVPLTMTIGSHACIRVCANESYPAIQLYGTVNGPNGMPVLVMQPGCVAGTTPCNEVCTPITPPPMVWTPDAYYEDSYTAENECFWLYLSYIHDAVWALEIYTFDCQGCFCLTYDDQLPVEFRSPFTAVAGSGDVTLQWTTASESNNDHFNLLRAGELKAMLPGLGSSAVGQSYSWTDTDVIPGVTYEYSLVAVDRNGARHEVGTASAAPHGPSDGLVTDYALYQNYPNPFNPVTSIAFDVKEAGFVKLRVFNPLGADVATLVAGDMGAGHYTVPFDAHKLPSGLYFYTISISDRFSATRKMLLVK